jgi:hypothetical protein
MYKLSTYEIIVQNKHIDESHKNKFPHIQWNDPPLPFRHAIFL